MIKAYAKINLSLDILDKRKDGFHNINSVMQQINLFDELEFKESNDIIVQSQFKDDIILKTVLKLKELFDIKEGVEVLVKKNIPSGAGLGGGSSDAAATLIELNSLWELGLSTADLIEIAVQIGADVPFFLIGGCCFVSGTGDIIEKLKGIEMDIVLINPCYSISTKTAYSELDKQKFVRKGSSLKLKNTANIKEISSFLHNDFINIQKEDVKKRINEIIGYGALNASITGKGPTVFGIFENKEKATYAYENLKDIYDFIYQTRTIIKKPTLNDGIS